jgi:uncharacterized protein (DUF4415 family)
MDDRIYDRYLISDIKTKTFRFPNCNSFKSPNDHSEREQTMNNASSPTTSETDWARIDAMQDEDIDFSDLPEITELTEAQIARSKLRFGGVKVEPGKRPVQVLLDDNIVDYFMAQSSDRTYHQLINTALTEYIHQHPLQHKSA